MAYLLAVAKVTIFRRICSAGMKNVISRFARGGQRGELNSYFIGQRRREIAIRRVFGAEISSITLRLLRTVTIQSFVAAIIAIPLACWLAPMAGSISGLQIHMKFIPLLYSLVIVLAVNLLTAALQGLRAATDNPVDSIKNE